MLTINTRAWGLHGGGLVAKSCQTHQAPLSMGFSRKDYWSGLSCPLPGDLLHPGVELRSPALQAGSLPTEPPGKPECYITFYKCYFNQNGLNPLPNNPSLGSSWIFFLNETFDISRLTFICYRSQMWLNKNDNKRLTFYLLSLNHLTPRCTIIPILYQANRFKEINMSKVIQLARWQSQNGDTSLFSTVSRLPD